MKKQAQKRKAPDLRDRILRVENEGMLFPFLQEQLHGKNRNNIKTLLTCHQVEVNGTPQTKYNFALKPGDQIRILPDRIQSSLRSFQGFSIVYEDPHLIVIDKHAGILSVATEKEKKNTAYSFLSAHVKTEHPSNKIFIVHRLDKDTSGLMVFARSEKVQALFQEKWKETVTERTYIAIVEGNVEDNAGVVSSYLHENKARVVYSNQNPEGGKEAITHFQVLNRKSGLTLLRVHLDTGRKNQIRVHMSELGHPIVNDKKYGSTTNPIGRLGLHSKTLAFTHPVTGILLRFETPMPRKFARLF
ncbi:MAG TPA: RluA family pseudouridine synthase [Prolixibacteraceae bacterium]|nr:RluA family pseudouridine synthase [Prolixibacteraceae bacterium]